MRQLDLLTGPLPRAPLAPRAEASPAGPARREDAAAALAAWLHRALDCPVRLQVTDNHRTMVSARRTGDGRIVRVHHMFLSAPEAVRDALARYLAQGDAQSCKAVDAFIAAHRDAIRPRAAAAPTLVDGVVHPLGALRDDFLAELVPEARGVVVTYGRGGSSHATPTRRRSMHLGTYLRDAALVRIHPVLDAAWVPRYFVAFVLHHELLHHAIPPRVVAGQRRVHPPDFVARERLFPQYEEALRWERANLPRLVRARDGAEEPA